jgi:hypothetical protein
VSRRPPLWTPEEAREEAEREAEPELSSSQKLAGCLADGCLSNGCLALLPVPCLVLGLFLWLR